MRKIFIKYHFYFLPLYILLIISQNVSAGETNASTVVQQPQMSLQQAKTIYSDPAFGTSTMRASADNMRPEYSQLQAWNADMSLLLVNGTEIVDATTFELAHTIDYGWPAYGEGWRWSPVDPMALYYIGADCITGSGCNSDDYGEQGTGPVLRKYELTLQGTTITGKRKLVASFPEYQEIARDQSYEELSDDGRYVALLGLKSDGSGDIFSYDLQTKTKGQILSLSANTLLSLDWVAMSPSGTYLIAGFANGYAQHRGVEAYDRITMAYEGKVALTLGHNDFIMDGDGNDYMIQTNASNAYLLNNDHYLIKSKIPNGVIFNGQGYPDENTTVSSGATVPLLSIDWSSNLHISCRTREVKTNIFCIVGTYSGQTGFDNGWQPFENEIFKVYLDSTLAQPHVDRLAHHRSQPSPYSTDGCPDAGSYWAQPHATVSPDGTKIVFGSNWGNVCDLANPVYLFQLTSGSEKTDFINPSPPQNLAVN